MANPTQFEASYHFRTVQAVILIRETEDFLWVQDTEMLRPAIRRSKTAGDRQYFDTFDEAKNWLIDRMTEDLEVARRQLQHAQGVLGNVKGLKPPTESAGA